jgi:glycylpeptide N-tetradecanoyltransferase
VGVREVGGKNRLMGFITGVPVHMRIYDKQLPMAEINFLCVHKKLRSKRLAPVLIKEVTRRVNLTNVWQAVYTAGVVIPKPVSKNRYYHRSLNPKKLIEVGFSRLQPRMTITGTIRLYRESLPKEPQTKGIRPLELKDCKEAFQLLNTHLQKYQLVQVFDEEEFKHWFMPRQNIMSSYVVQDPETKKLTDFCSFYTLNSTIIGNQKHPTLRAAYSFYNVSTKTSWPDLMTDALVLAKDQDFDVFNALDVMDNEAFFKKLKFGIGDGHLQYYLYNWRCPEMTPNQVGLVLM